MPIKILVLDDDEERLKQFRKMSKSTEHEIEMETVKTAKECIDLLSKNEYQIVFLDHDLNDEVFVSTAREDTGSSVARWIHETEEFPSKKAVFFVHSFNTVGANNMLKLIKGSIFCPGIWTNKNGFKQAIKFQQDVESF